VGSARRFVPPAGGGGWGRWGGGGPAGRGAPMNRKCALQAVAGLGPRRPRRADESASRAAGGSGRAEEDRAQVGLGARPGIVRVDGGRGGAGRLGRCLGGGPRGGVLDGGRAREAAGGR